MERKRILSSAVFVTVALCFAMPFVYVSKANGWAAMEHGLGLAGGGYIVEIGSSPNAFEIELGTVPTPTVPIALACAIAGALAIFVKARWRYVVSATAGVAGLVALLPVGGQLVRGLQSYGYDARMEWGYATTMAALALAAALAAYLAWTELSAKPGPSPLTEDGVRMAVPSTDGTIAPALYCSKCGRSLAGARRFCPECGSEVRSAETVT